MGIAASCASEIEDIFEVTKPVDPPPKQDYDNKKYQPNAGYFQPQGAQGAATPKAAAPQPRFQPEWYKQDVNKKEADEPRPKSKAVPYQNQDYFKIKKHLQETGQLFVDPEFPPTGKSLFWSKSPPNGIKWKRPSEIVDNPQFMINGVQAADFLQGQLGNCWFVATASTIALHPKLVTEIIPDWKTQGFTKQNGYCGMFHFHFFFFGRWIDVVVDDYLPTINNRLCYMRSAEQTEFWSALIEKAYAKLFGDYESLQAGRARDAMVDMTGGLGHLLDMDKARDKVETKMEIYQQLLEGTKYHSLMSAHIIAKGKGDMEKKLNCGLIKGHEYSIIECKEIPQGDGTPLPMIKLRNPWGKKEWTGAYSDGSPEWQRLTQSEKEKNCLVFRDDGEFWMTFEDFAQYYDKIDICNMLKSPKNKDLKGRQTYGTLRKPDRCGGCVNHKDTFLQNPQYTFHVANDDDEILIYMEQSDTRIWREKGQSDKCIGFAVLEADLSSGKRVSAFTRATKVIQFSTSRCNFTRCKFKAGTYLLVPSTFKPGDELTFLIRIYGESDPKLSAELAD